MAFAFCQMMAYATFALLVYISIIFYAKSAPAPEQRSLTRKQCVLFMILNMDKNVERFENLSSKLKEIECFYLRIPGVDGKLMKDNIDARQILKPRKELLNQTFFCLESDEKWVYDGSISTSFPNLFLNGHYGTKGLTLSNIKAFELASVFSHAFDWFCVLEDDAEIDKSTHDAIIDYCQKRSPSETDCILMDKRAGGWGGACAVCYSSCAIKRIKEDLHPLSQFSLNSHKFGERMMTNLWDWKLWKYINYVSQRFAVFPIVTSGNFPSTIDVP